MSARPILCKFGLAVKDFDTAPYLMSMNDVDSFTYGDVSLYDDMIWLTSELFSL